LKKLSFFLSEDRAFRNYEIAKSFLL